MLVGSCLFKAPEDVINEAYVRASIDAAEPPCVVSSEALAFILAALTINPAQRPSCEGLLATPWLNRGSLSKSAPKAAAPVETAAAAPAEECRVRARPAARRASASQGVQYSLAL